MGTAQPSDHRTHAAMVGHLVAQVALAALGREGVLRLPALARMGTKSTQPHGTLRTLRGRGRPSVESYGRSSRADRSLEVDWRRVAACHCANWISRSRTPR